MIPFYVLWFGCFVRELCRRVQSRPSMCVDYGYDYVERREARICDAIRLPETAPSVHGTKDSRATGPAQDPRVSITQLPHHS